VASYVIRVHQPDQQAESLLIRHLQTSSAANEGWTKNVTHVQEQDCDYKRQTLAEAHFPVIPALMK
jgi:hypothetical protein